MHRPHHTRAFAAARAVLLAAASIGLSGSIFATAVAAASGGAGACHSAGDLFQASQDALASCGLREFPLQSIVTNKDGSREYRYVVYGNPTVVLVPPPGWNPVTATPRSLARYGLRPPPPKTQAVAYKTWTAEMERWNAASPPERLLGAPLIVGSPRTRTSSSGVVNDVFASDNWSGMDFGSDFIDGPMTAAYGRWIEPSDHGTACPNAMASIWAGIGGENTGYLAQSGTQIGAGLAQFGAAQHSAWYEVLPADPTEVLVPVSGSAGAAFQTSTVYTGGGTYTFGWWNIGTGQSLTVQQTVPSYEYDGSSAEWIGERPEYDGALTPLTNWGTLEFTNAATNYGSATDGALIAMENPSTGDLLATGGSAYNNSGAFNDLWSNCQ